MALVVRRFDVFLVTLDPTVGHEIKKTRPALVVSPDEMNEFLSTYIVAPMTTKGRHYPTRIPCIFQRKQGQIVLDQMRTLDRSRLVRRLGRISPSTQTEVLAALQEMFAE
jgi:mRNA interferase MazF